MKNIISKIFTLIEELFLLKDLLSRRVLQISNGIENLDGLVTHLVVALAVAWLICFLALSKGVQSLGKVKSISWTDRQIVSCLYHNRLLILLLYSLM